MNIHLSKIMAILEAAFVPLVLFPLLGAGLSRLFPEIGTIYNQPLSFLPYIVMLALAFVMILLHRQDIAAAGIDFRNPRYHLGVFAALFIPVTLSSLPMGLGLDYRTWTGALVLVPVQIALLVICGLLLRRKPAVLATAGASLLLFPLRAPFGASNGILAVQSFLYYGLFVGFGEEIMYRGYILTRLDRAFGRPFRFFGVAWGWGVLLSALIFGLTHARLMGSLLNGGAPIWPWAAWTFFAGLVFAFVREKTGSIFAPALLHGIPQALATAIMALMGG